MPGTRRRMGALFILIAFALLVHADEYNNFINPPANGSASDFSQNDVWSLGSTQLIQWSTSYPSYNIILWQQNLSVAAAIPGSSVFAKATTDPEIGHFSWVVQLYQFNLAASNVFYFDTQLNDFTQFTSHYFNITNAVSTSTITASTSATSSNVFGLSTSTALVISNAASSTANSSSLSGEPSTEGSNVGLAAGLGVAIPALIIVAAISGFIILRKRRNRVPRQPPFDEGPERYSYHELLHQRTPPKHSPDTIQPQAPEELMTTELPLPELPGS